MKSYKCKIMLKSNLNINCLSISKYILSELSINLTFGILLQNIMYMLPHQIVYMLSFLNACLCNTLLTKVD